MRHAHAVPPASPSLPRTGMVADGGFRVYADFPDSVTCGRLLAEAVALYPEASHQECWEDDYADGRGGRPRRRLLSSLGGSVQDEMYRSEWLPRLLTNECGVPIYATGNRGSYSYYARAGDFLDLHLDVDRCDVTMIAVLHDNSAPDDPAGSLVLYPGRVGEPLNAVRARMDGDGYCVKLAPGQSIVFFGGLVPHRLLPVADGQVRIISVLCFGAQF